MAERTVDVPTAASRKQKVQWPFEAEKKLIEVWSEVLALFQGQMITKKAMGQKAADLLNPYVQKEFNLPPYSVAEVLSKVDNLARKARHFYDQIRCQPERGQKADNDDIELDWKQQHSSGLISNLFTICLEIILH